VARAVVAGQLLPAGQPIHASALREIGVDTPPAESYGQPELLVGQVPRIDIPEGTVITSSLMSNPLAMQLQPGERALAVPVDDITGVGSRVQPGDYVDVVLTVKMTDASPGVALSSEHPESRLLASRLRVLAFGTRDLPSVRNNTASKPESGNGAAHADAEAPPRMAVLAVPLAEVDPLVLGAQNGKLSLALRHPGDEGMPGEQLFPLPAPVLMPRGDLTAEQRSWLAAPENRAYAGMDLSGLVGRSRTLATAPKPRASGTGGVEIIRGSAASSARNQVAVNP
jgi:pilus assembly protein CpaB